MTWSATFPSAAGVPPALSAGPFPGFQRKISWVKEEMGGNWYRSDDPPMEGWLCPALLHYFKSPPAELYVKAEALR